MNEANKPENGEEGQNKVFFRGGFYWIAAGAVTLCAVVVWYSRVFPTLEGQYTFIGQNVLNVLIIAAITVQALIYRRQWDSMEKSLFQAERSSIYANRAYVVAKMRDIGERDDTLQFRLRIENSGNTPANDVVVVYDYGLRDEPPHKETPDGPVAFDGGWTQEERLGLIAPNGSYHVISTPEYSFKSPAEFQQFDSGQLKFYCWGKIIYEDMFNRKRRTDFCFFQSPGQHAYGYPCKHGNEAVS